MHVEWVTLLSDKINDTYDRKFSGIAVIEEWSGEFKRAFSYNSAGKHMSVYLNEAITYSRSSFKRSVICIDVEYWGSAGVPGYEVPKYLGKETFCSENGSGTGGEDQGHPNNPITEEQAEPGDYISYYFDCNGDLEGSAIIDNNCGCIGGNTGISECPTKQIKHKLDSFPCAKSLVLQMPTLNSDISNLIKNTFGKNDKINLTVEANQSLKGTSTDGQLGPSSQFTLNNNLYFDISIGINPDILKNATKEYILVTIYHEALHAYFSFKRNQLGETEFNNQFTGMFVNGGRLIGAQDPQHWSMGYTNFVNGLRDVIIAYNPNFDRNRAYALALGGINDLTPAQLLINQKEKNTSVAGYTGTKCP